MNSQLTALIIIIIVIIIIFLLVQNNGSDDSIVRSIKAKAFPAKGCCPSDSRAPACTCPTCPAGPPGATGPAGPPGAAGATGATGPAGGTLGSAEFVRLIQSPNNSVAPGTAFTVNTQVFNTMPSSVVATAGAGGTVWTLNTIGTYIFDYEMSLGSAGSVALYTGPTAGSLSIDNNTIAGSSTATTWIHARAGVVVASTPVVVAVSSVVGTAAVVPAGNAAGFYTIRVNITRVA
jgi:hypothetical protein